MPIHLQPRRGDLSDPEKESALGIGLDAFRDALARWASGVAVVAVREEGRVLATTVSAFMSASAEPPLVVFALGPGAQVLPYLTEGRRFGVSVLSEAQGRIASVFADSFPVGPSPFQTEGDPVIPGALARLGCRVRDSHPAGDHELVLGLVDAAALAGGAPLIRWQRRYHRLAP